MSDTKPVPRLILVKGHCTHCNAPVGVEIPEPEPKIEKVTEPCKCGMTADARATKYIVTALATGVVSIMITLLGSCISNQIQTTRQIEILKKDYEIYNIPSGSGWLNTPDNDVRKKKEEKK